MKQVSFTFAFIGLVIGAFFFGKRFADEKIITSYDTIIKYDTVWRTIETTKPIPVYVVRNDTVYQYDTITFTEPVDTSAILADFYSTYNYLDTIHRKDLTLILSEGVSRNRIQERYIDYQILRPTSVVTNELSGFFVGADISLNSFRPEASYIHKNFEYSLGYDLGYNHHNSISIGLKYKIR